MSWIDIRDAIVPVLVSGLIGTLLGLIGSKLSPALDKLSDKIASWFKKIDDPLPDSIETVVDATIDSIEAKFDAAVEATLTTLPALIAAAKADGTFTAAELKTILSTLKANFKTQVAATETDTVKTGLAAIWSAVVKWAGKTAVTTWWSSIVTKVKSFFGKKS